MYLNSSGNKYIFVILLVLFLSACKKQIVSFDTPPNDDFELSTILNFDGKKCAFDANLKILKYSIGENSLNSFSPLVEFSIHSSVRFEGSLLDNHSVNNLGNLTLNTPYQILITTQGEESEFDLVFTSLPIVQIISHDEMESGQKALSKMVINYPEPNMTSDENWTGVELRGASSLEYEKNSFGVGVYATPSLDYPMSSPFFSFNSDQKWILNAMYIDKSRLRNKLSFELWKSMSGPADHIGIDMEYVEVFVNREARGLYAFSMKYTEEFLQLGSEAVLYEGVDNTYATQFDELPVDNPDNYIWEGWEQKYPDPSVQVKWDDFEQLSELIIESSDVNFEANIGSAIDLDNVIDYYLFVNLCYAIDNVGKNWMFLKRNQTSKFIIIPWDLDGTWGKDPFGESEPDSLIVSNSFFHRLEELDPENYNQRLKQRWQELRLSEFSDANLSSLISSNFMVLDNSQVIPFENQLWQLSINLQSEESYIESWLSDRLTFLDGYFQ